MSIIIKSNELNTLIYKYLLQAGLTHTSYTLFNEAKLQPSLQEFKYDIKSGHLLMLLEKGLILSQIESHVNFGDYHQCLEPFYLLKSHTCKITQKVKTDQDNFMKQLNNNITECIKRTNAIYNTQLTNKNYEEIVYEPRGANYFEKFQKFRITEGENADLEGENVRIDGQKDSFIIVWNRNENVIYLAQNDGFEETIIRKVYPCTLNGQMQPLLHFKLNPTSLIMVFSQNRVNLINRQTDQSIEFTIPLKQSLTQIEFNPNISNLIVFQSRLEYFVMNLKNMEEICQGKGFLKWRGFDEFVLLDQGHLFLKSLVKQQPLISYLPPQIDQQFFTSEIGQIQISHNKTFFYLVNYKRNKICVYTFEKQECLYVFDFSDEQEEIHKVIWSHRNEVDYLYILTDIAIRVWEVELNSYCLKIDLEKYDLGDIQSIVSLEKNETETFLLALGTKNLLVSDIANQKIERIESPANSSQMQNVGKNSVFVSTDQNVYFLDGQRLSQLFK